MSETKTKAILTDGLTLEEHQALKELAKQQDRTVSSLVRTLLRAAIAESKGAEREGR